MRALTEAQHARLDSFADEFPEARVVGWLDDSPILRHDTGSECRITPIGRLVVLHD